MTLRVYDEGCEIVWAVVRTQTWKPIVRATSGERSCMESTHGRSAWRRERHMKPRNVGNWLRDLLDSELVTRTCWAIANCLLLLSRAEVSPYADVAKWCEGGIVEASRSLDVLGAD